MAFSKIATCRNWGNIDKLEELALKDGETLKIKFPDGGIEVHNIIVVEKSTKGRYEDTYDSRAYVIVNYRGFETLISLVGLEAERIVN